MKFLLARHFKDGNTFIGVAVFFYLLHALDDVRTYR